MVNTRDALQAYAKSLPLRPIKKTDLIITPILVGISGWTALFQLFQTEYKYTFGIFLGTLIFVMGIAIASCIMYSSKKKSGIFYRQE